MILSAVTQYAIILLKSLRASIPLDLVDLCREYKLSTCFMQKIGRELKKAGYVDAKRGPGGGYIRANRLVSIAEVILLLNANRKKVSTHPSLQIINNQIVKNLDKFVFNVEDKDE